jgi:predicted Rossmann fold nucleotide-binding protein DprA/Smf involved in DNA uptake
LKIAIIGSREFKNLHLVSSLCSLLPSDTELVSGGAKGIDKTAEDYFRFSSKHCIEPKIFLPNYALLGFLAPTERNKLIANYAEIVVAFSNGSSGTANCLQHARNYKKKIYIFTESSTLEDLQSFIDELRS